MRLAVPASRPFSRLTETRLLLWVAAITISGFFTVALALGLGLDGNAFIVLAAFLLPLFVPRDLSVLARYKYTWMTLGLLLLVATAVRGEEINGARIWFR